MLSAIRAESLKLTRHKATWFLVWLYPIGFVLIFLVAILGSLASGDAPEQLALDKWISDTAMVWWIPGNAIGRYLIAAFTAVAFAGEYGWNTWKLIVPHRSRTSLIAAKYVMVVVLLTLALALAAALSVLGCWLDDLVTGDTTPAGITVGGLLATHGRAALSAAAPALVTIGYASLAAILTRSTIAALVVAIVAVTVEQLIFNFGPMLSLRAPQLTWLLYHGLPGYHLSNLFGWIREGTGYVAELPRAGTVALSWGASLAAALAWIAGLAALTLVSFKRQDLN
jgi:hypothetical protein